MIKQQQPLRTRRGQAMIEYVVVAGMLMATVVIFLNVHVRLQTGFGAVHGYRSV